MELDLRAKVSFNKAANDYDKYRPNYPKKALNDMLSLSGIGLESKLLEVGCGTGQATKSLAERGLMIDAIELGPDLAEIAAKNVSRWPRVQVIVGNYEDYKFKTEEYNLIYSAQAFHWIEPSIRLQKSAHLLQQNGSLALLYNSTNKLEGTLAILSERLQKLTGNPIGSPNITEDMERWKTEIKESKLFDNLIINEYPWCAIYNIEAYQGLYNTYSDFADINDDLRRRTAETIKQTITEAGGTIKRDYICTLYHAKKV
jgi:SAM-dependent methyltransferase